MRACGVLLPITSLPSKYGVGCFSKSAYEFVDFLKAAKQTYWQVLPMGITSYGDSPYQSFSTFAGNPYMIDLEQLIQEGLLSSEECERVDMGEHPQYIDYAKLYESRYYLLHLAYVRHNLEEDEKYKKFIKENKSWLDDFAFFMAIKKKYGDVCWLEWPKPLRRKQEKVLEIEKKILSSEIGFYKYLQFLFAKQWKGLKAYANKKGIKIIGDIPIYVALDSSDVWANPELFQFDKHGSPIAVAGCPPDAFSETGQLWGNPLYAWREHKKTNYKWWTKRMAHCKHLFDSVRIDHFRGFDAYYAIPYGDKTAEFGTWEQGPGMELFDAMRESMGDMEVIAEDLGFITESVRKLVKDSGFPSMKVLEFAFNAKEDSDYLPHNYDKNCVVYTGTHDNETIVGWYQNLKKKDRQYANCYLNIEEEETEDIHWKFIRLAHFSVANLSIIPMQDYLGLDNAARVNTPSTVGDNWKWRLEEGELTEDLARKMKQLAKISRRIPKKN